MIGPDSEDSIALRLLLGVSVLERLVPQWKPVQWTLVPNRAMESQVVSISLQEIGAGAAILSLGVGAMRCGRESSFRPPLDESLGELEELDVKFVQLREALDDLRLREGNRRGSESGRGRHQT
jgi:hypothetical protein